MRFLSSEDVNILYGFTDSDGTVISGSSGYNVVKDTHTGVYKVTFNTPFATTPAVVATVDMTKDDPSSINDGKIATLNNLDESGFQLVITNTGSDKKNYKWSFIAIGN